MVLAQLLYLDGNYAAESTITGICWPESGAGWKRLNVSRHIYAWHVAGVDVWFGAVNQICSSLTSCLRDSTVDQPQSGCWCTLCLKKKFPPFNGL